MQEAKMNNAVEKENLAAAINYYNAMLNKDFDTISSYLHDDIIFIAPIAEMHGKEEVMSAANKFAAMLQELNIRSTFANDNEVMLAYDVVFSDPIGKCRAAALIDFANGKIIKMELFYDGRPFSKLLADAEK